MALLWNKTIKKFCFLLNFVRKITAQHGVSKLSLAGGLLSQSHSQGDRGLIRSKGECHNPTGPCKRIVSGGDTQAARMEKGTPYKWNRESWESSTLSVKTEFRITKKTRTLHNNPGIHPRSIQKDANNCEYIRTQHRSSSLHSAKINGHKGRN